VKYKEFLNKLQESNQVNQTTSILTEIDNFYSNQLPPSYEDVQAQQMDES